MLKHVKETANTIFSSPNRVIEEKQFQPNALDITLGRVFEMRSVDPFKLRSDDSKDHLHTEEVFPDQFTNDFYFEKGKVYQILANENVKVAFGEAGRIIQRSSLNRNGLIINSGLYDSGYEGVIGFTLISLHADAYIEKDSRIGQFLIFSAECIGQYEGSYGSGKSYDESTYKK